ncbi:MAG: TIM barrel protein [Tunicatimonas sp.]
MKINQDNLQDFNASQQAHHQQTLSLLGSVLDRKNVDIEPIIKRLLAFQVAIPSWALGAGGTRFGRFPLAGVPTTLEDKLEDVGLLHALNGSSGAISLHIPWDIPQDHAAVKQQADALGIRFDAMNSNTFQDQPNQAHSYKFGSLSHVDQAVRQQAIDHNAAVIEHGRALGSQSLTVWLADGANFPGQYDFRGVFERTLDSLQAIYQRLPDDWRVLIEYKPYEPNFYATVIQDWGTSLLLASDLGPKAFTLVDLGHHLPNTNIEQIVATLIMRGKLGGFHFNDSKYGDDDLTVGAIRPYQLFLIFNEIIRGLDDPHNTNPPLAWMIDASHNTKDPLEDLLQSVEAILISLAQTLLVDRKALRAAQANNDVVMAQEILQDAYRTDARPLVREAARRAGAALYPLLAYRHFGVRDALTKARTGNTVATGL